MKKQNKKAVSLMISYVLLIVMAISMAVGVYSWLRFYAPTEAPEECDADAVLTVIDYDCDANIHEISLTIKNTGFFSVDGFFIRGTSSNNSDDPATVPLDLGQAGATLQPIVGTYYSNDVGAPPEKRFTPTEEKSLKADYADVGGNLTKLQIQPFQYGEEGLLLCDNVFTLRPSDDKKCT